ncbi:hypothetical protein ABFA07_018677 [Porites harrisoni]
MGFGHRNCVVLGCPNSGQRLGKWAATTCELHGCNNGSSMCDCQPPFKLFPFPTEKKNPERRLQWAKNISRNSLNGTLWMPNKDSRVCNLHFVDGEPTAENPDPTLQLGHSKKTRASKRPPPTPRDNSLAVRSRKRAKLDTCSDEIPVPVLDHSADNLACDDVELQDPEPSTPINDCVDIDRASVIHDHCYVYGWYEINENSNFCMNTCCLKSRQDKDKKIVELSEKIQELSEKVKLLEVQLVAKQDKGLKHSDLRNDQTVNLLTGIPSKPAFHKLFHSVKGSIKKVRYWSGPKKTSRKGRNFRKSPKKFGPNRALSQKDEFLLTLMKLRLGSTNADLAQRFGISRSTVSTIFNTWVKILANELKCLIYNPSMEVVKKTLPKKFKKPGYCKVRHIIDCTEIFIETPSNPVIRASTWSDYKHHNTAKILVSITPNGAFNFISEAWGGRTSDVHLTRESEFYNILEPYDAVMADRGFTIAEDLLLHRADLFIPPGKRGQEQFTKADVQKTKTIANLRIFVEQAIRRLKTFRIIKNELPISLIGNLDNIIIVCAALCNLYKPLCK